MAGMAISRWLALMSVVVSAAAGADLDSISTYKAKYGETKGEVAVDAERELPRYPAVKPAEAVGTWEVKEGFRLTLAAAEPQVRDPIAICFDERGRMFVCEMHDYSEMRDVTPHLGRVSMLEDRDGDGSYESSVIFADDLPWPTGLIWANGGLFVGATPDIWRFEDRDGDGKAEVREKVFTGFGTGLKLLNVQGLMNSFEWGQDNRVHVLAGGGNRGTVVRVNGEDADQDEGVDLRGRDFWFDPVTLEYGLEDGGAQYGMSFDDYGRKFGCSNSDHLQYWAYEDRYGERNPYVSMPRARQSIAADGGAAEVFRISPDEPWRILRTRWRIAGVVKGVVEGGGRVSGYFTGATGTTIYRGDAYGAAFVGNSFTGDAGGQLIHRKVIRPSEDGISLVGERPADEQEFEFAASRDTWVRVVNFANAPDGCLYVCDMYREVIEHPWSIPDEIKQHIDLNSGNDRGRIYRIEPDGWEKPKGRERRGILADSTTVELVAMLSHPNGWHRDTAQRLLYERQDASAVPLLSEVMGGEDPVAKLHALGLLSGLGALNADLLVEALEDQDSQVRERACVLAEAHLEGHSETADALISGVLKQARNGQPRERFQSLLTLGGLVGKGLGEHPDAVDDAILSEFARTLGDREALGWEWLRQAVVSAPPDVVAWTLDLRVNTMDTTPEAWLDLLPLIGVVARRDSPEGRTSLCREIAGAPGEVQSALLQAAAEGFRKAGVSLATADSEGALNGVMSAALDTMQARKAASDQSPRLAAIELLAFAEAEMGDEAQVALLACLSEEESDEVQSAALDSLSGRRSKVPYREMVSAWADLKAGARKALLTSMLGNAKGAAILLEAVADAEDDPRGLVPSDFSAAQVQGLIQSKDPKLAERAREVLASVVPPSREEVAARYAPATALTGDAARGRNHYIGRCMACHRAEGMGMELGPDLVTVKTRGRAGILEAILNPHKEVAPQYIAYTVTAKDGRTVTGLITKDDATGVSVKAMGGMEFSFPRAEIEGTSSVGQSVMPEGLETGMSVEDVADLLRFVEEL